MANIFFMPPFVETVKYVPEEFLLPALRRPQLPIVKDTLVRNDLRFINTHIKDRLNSGQGDLLIRELNHRKSMLGRSVMRFLDSWDGDEEFLPVIIKSPRVVPSCPSAGKLCFHRYLGQRTEKKFWYAYSSVLHHQFDFDGKEVPNRDAVLDPNVLIDSGIKGINPFDGVTGYIRVLYRIHSSPEHPDRRWTGESRAVHNGRHLLSLIQFKQDLYNIYGINLYHTGRPDVTITAFLCSLLHDQNEDFPQLTSQEFETDGVGRGFKIPFSADSIFSNIYFIDNPALAKSSINHSLMLKSMIEVMTSNSLEEFYRKAGKLRDLYGREGNWVYAMLMLLKILDRADNLRTYFRMEDRAMAKYEKKKTSTGIFVEMIEPERFEAKMQESFKLHHAETVVNQALGIQGWHPITYPVLMHCCGATFENIYHYRAKIVAPDDELSFFVPRTPGDIWY